jgi:hypothetical protein
VYSQTVEVTLYLTDKLPLPILTPHNYFTWKSAMVVLLWSKGLYRVTIGTKKEPTQNVEKPKWHNCCDEALGLICLSLSRNYCSILKA